MKMRTIHTDEEFSKLLDASKERPVLIFKHSSACPISARAYGQVERFLDGADAPRFEFGMVVVQEARALSNRIAETLDVEHETPQAIVVRDGEPVWNASHFRVTGDALAEALQ